MRIQKRTGVFETNSSSTHSVSICNNGNLSCKVKSNYRKEIIATGRYFSSGPSIYNSFDEKLSFLITLIFRCCNNVEDIVEKKEDTRYKLLEKVVKEHTGLVLNVLPDISQGPIFGDVHDEDASEIVFKSEENLASFLFNPDSYMKTMPLGYLDDWANVED